MNRLTRPNRPRAGGRPRGPRAQDPAGRRPQGPRVKRESAPAAAERRARQLEHVDVVGGEPVVDHRRGVGRVAAKAQAAPPRNEAAQRAAAEHALGAVAEAGNRPGWPVQNKVEAPGGVLKPGTPGGEHEELGGRAGDGGRRRGRRERRAEQCEAEQGEMARDRRQSKRGFDPIVRVSGSLPPPASNFSVTPGGHALLEPVAQADGDQVTGLVDRR